MGASSNRRPWGFSSGTSSWRPSFRNVKKENAKKSEGFFATLGASARTLGTSFTAINEEDILTWMTRVGLLDDIDDASESMATWEYSTTEMDDLTSLKSSTTTGSPSVSSRQSVSNGTQNYDQHRSSKTETEEEEDNAIASSFQDLGIFATEFWRSLTEDGDCDSNNAKRTERSTHRNKSAMKSDRGNTARKSLTVTFAEDDRIGTKKPIFHRWKRLRPTISKRKTHIKQSIDVPPKGSRWKMVLFRRRRNVDSSETRLRQTEGEKTERHIIGDAKNIANNDFENEKSSLEKTSYFFSFVPEETLQLFNSMFAFSNDELDAVDERTESDEEASDAGMEEQVNNETTVYSGTKVAGDQDCVTSVDSHHNQQALARTLDASSSPDTGDCEQENEIKRSRPSPPPYEPFQTLLVEEKREAGESKVPPPRAMISVHSVRMQSAENDLIIASENTMIEESATAPATAPVPTIQRKEFETEATSDQVKNYNETRSSSNSQIRRNETPKAIGDSPPADKQYQARMDVPPQTSEDVLTSTPQNKQGLYIGPFPRFLDKLRAISQIDTRRHSCGRPLSEDVSKLNKSMTEEENDKFPVRITVGTTQDELSNERNENSEASTCVDNKVASKLLDAEEQLAQRLQKQQDNQDHFMMEEVHPWKLEVSSNSKNLKTQSSTKGPKGLQTTSDKGEGFEAIVKNQPRSGSKKARHKKTKKHAPCNIQEKRVQKDFPVKNVQFPSDFDVATDHRFGDDIDDPCILWIKLALAQMNEVHEKGEIEVPLAEYLGKRKSFNEAGSVGAVAPNGSLMVGFFPLVLESTTDNDSIIQETKVWEALNIAEGGERSDNKSILSKPWQVLRRSRFSPSTMPEPHTETTIATTPPNQRVKVKSWAFSKSSPEDASAARDDSDQEVTSENTNEREQEIYV